MDAEAEARLQEGAREADQVLVELEQEVQVYNQGPRGRAMAA